ncbi:hypothetical protein DFH06DRAFT_1343462 [Mycena polygramma]|nr:hypothetical protein DFH06DRAFT_1343462 [Mycena polygramma]
MNLLRRLTPRRPRFRGLDELPMELWQQIITELDDDGLLATAGVCRAFNFECINQYLLTNGFSRVSVAAGSFDITSALAPLAVLQRSLFIHITRLSCDFAESVDLCRDLRIVRDIVARSTQLKDLALHFPDAAFGVAPEDKDSTAWCRSLADVPSSMSAIHNAFHDVMYAMCAKTLRVINIDPWGVSQCLPKHLSRVQLEPGYRDFSSAAIPFRRLVGKKDSRYYVDEPNYKFPLIWATSVKLRRLRQQTNLSDCITLIMTNPEIVKSIDLELLSIYASSSGVDVRTICAHIDLPVLRAVFIGGGIAMDDNLRQFLSRHPTVEAINYQHAATTSAVAVTTITVPALRCIGSATSAGLELLMNAVEPHEPAVLEVCVGAHNFFDVPMIEPSISLLRRIAQRRTKTRLHIDLFPNLPTVWSDEHLAILKSIKSVSTVRISAIGNAEKLLSWLGELPRLRKIEVVDGDSADKGQQRRQKFAQVAQAVLPTRPVIQFVPNFRLVGWV